MLPMPATSSTICIGSGYWRTNACQRGSVAATANLFGPYCSSRAAASATARPGVGVDAEPPRDLLGRQRVPALVGEAVASRSVYGRGHRLFTLLVCGRDRAPSALPSPANRPGVGEGRRHPKRMNGAVTASVRRRRAPRGRRAATPRARAVRAPRRLPCSASRWWGCGSMSPSACARTAVTAIRANHLWSAGITHHGAQLVLVSPSIAANARW